MKNINTPNSIMKLRNLMDSIHNNVVFQKTNQIHLSHSILQARLALANINTIKTNANLVNFPIIKASVQHSSLALQTQAFMSILDYKAHIFSIYPELKKSLIFEKTFNENIKIYNALIDSAILIYQNTTNEEIEVKIETQSESIILKRNLIIEYIEIFKNLVPPIAAYSPNAILLVVANPVDILTYITYKLSGFPKNRVIGSGTVLDSSRLRYALSEEFDIDARNVHAYIIGEHGDTEFPIWSSAHIGNMSISEYCRREKLDTHELEEKIHQKVKNAAYEIIRAKGYTNYAIALSVKRIVAAILRDENSILTISALDEKEQVYYSKPYVVGRKGPILDVCPPLSTEEVEKLKHAKNVLKKIIEETGI